MSEQWQQEERLFLHLGNERDTSGSGKRYFSRGGVKYALLELLAQEDMHGYQMMKALEEQSGGTYKPSAGSIYPTLQMLRDQGYVEPYKQDGKRVFQITEEGRAYLQDELDRPEASDSGEQGGWEPRVQEGEGQGAQEEGVESPDGVRRNRRLTPKGKELIHLLKAAERAALADADKAEQLRAALADLRRSLQLVVTDTAASESNDSAREASEVTAAIDAGARGAAESSGSVREADTATAALTAGSRGAAEPTGLAEAAAGSESKAAASDASDAAANEAGLPQPASTPDAARPGEGAE